MITNETTIQSSTEVDVSILVNLVINNENWYRIDGFIRPRHINITQLNRQYYGLVYNISIYLKQDETEMNQSELLSLKLITSNRHIKNVTGLNMFVSTKFSPNLKKKGIP